LKSPHPPTNIDKRGGRKGVERKEIQEFFASSRVAWGEEGRGEGEKGKAHATQGGGSSCRTAS